MFSNKIVKTILTFLGISFGIGMASAQDLQPVQWHVAATKISDNTYEVKYTATIDPHWYLYAQDISEGGPIPTHFELDTPNAHFTETIQEEGAVIEKYDDLFGIIIKKYATEVVFVAKIESNKVLKSISTNV
ncbi:MAG: hypothetical protein KDD49_10000, partial [Bacteroidetes bacterium]|nr:hypothetical protein [Bacteroidota bacterium]